MTLEAAIGALSVVAGSSLLWVFVLHRRVVRLEERAGLKKPPRPLFDD